MRYVTDKKDQAYQYWLNGMKYAEIANKCDISISAVKMWAVREWKNKNDSEVTKVTNEKVTAVTKLRLRKKGAAERNANAVKHGAYCGFFADTLTDEEREIMNGKSRDPEQECVRELNMLTIREKRILQRIKELYDNDEALVTERTRSRKLNIDSRVPSIAQTQTEAVVEKVAKSEMLNKLEQEMTRIQSQKIKYILGLVGLRKEQKAINDDITEQIRKELETYLDSLG